MLGQIVANAINVSNCAVLLAPTATVTFAQTVAVKLTFCPKNSKNMLYFTTKSTFLRTKATLQKKVKNICANN
ncbi:MAG: hypothetical protein IKD26_01805 [Clostridia bacterium]|nr:hypothetical protein [Clostridia bacterium]